uniref:Transferrin-like domain-containing protein n=1 Tax=Castor canadensis TaxID=51338 RepID=A0A8C0XST2_CASCN
MRLGLLALLCAGALGPCLAVPEKTVRWCAVSDHEAKKCSSFRDNMKTVLPADGPLVTCVKKTSYPECIKAISVNKADAVTVDGGLVFEASLAPYNLKPIVAEFYGSKDDPQMHHYVLAVVKKGTNFQLNQLQGQKSCHTGLGWLTGWYVPLSILLPSGSLETAATKFFSSSCVPCADKKMFPSLCQLCAGKGADKCACSSQEPYFSYSGAFKCLEDGIGVVSFVRHLTIFEILTEKADRDKYELLCPDNTRRPVDEYRECHLARVPSHAVVARSVDGREDLIWELLNQAQEHFGKDKSSQFQLFGSPHGRDLLFTDATQGFLRIPPKMDAKLYLGYESFSAIEHLKSEPKDGSEHLGSKCVNAPLEGYYVVAVVKKSDAEITWNSLRGKKSCHTAVGTSSGWNIPMGLIYNQTGSCKFDEFFSRSCAPGSNPDSPLCALCGGSSNPTHLCAPNSNERYFGSSGALRCLVEKGDVAFVKHPTVLQNTNGKNPEAWAKGLKQEDFQLLCLDGTRKPVTEAQNCHLAIVPNHAVVSRKDKADFVRRILFNQQELFGRNGFEYMMFQLFESSPKDLLFSGDTECLANLQNKTTYEKYLGPEHLTVMANFRQCLTSELLEACAFHRN